MIPIHEKQTNPRKWAGILAAGSVLVRAPLLKLFGREPDCWRRTLGLGLRSEGARFGLSSFGLRLPVETNPASTNNLNRFVEHFGRFLAGEPVTHFIVKHYPHHVERLAVPRVDLVLCQYDSEGELLTLRPQLDPREPMALDAASQRDIEQIIVQAHRATRHLSDINRFRALERDVQQQITSKIGTGKQNVSAFAGRILSACAISSGPVPAGTFGRFQPPDFRLHRGFGSGCFDAVIRPLPGGAVDLWLNIHHAAADGAPMQEMLGHLESAWGCEPIVFPPQDPARPWFIQNCQTPPADRPISLLMDFLDFTPLVACRTKLNARLAPAIGSPVPLAAMLLWVLAKEPEFAGRKFATAVDVPPDKRWPRAVDLVAIRPEDYFHRPDGFAAFARDFLGIVSTGQSRRSPTYAAMRALSFVAPRFAAEALASNPGRARATFGTVGLSLLKNAKIFTAPMADNSWDDGFLALGNLSQPAGNGRMIGALTVKGSPERITECATAFRHALNKANVTFDEIN